LDCPSPWRVDAVTAARSLNQQHTPMLVDRSGMSFQAWRPAAARSDPRTHTTWFPVHAYSKLISVGEKVMDAIL
jgi:hypothetical protein